MKTIEQRIRDLEQQMRSTVKYAPGGGAVAAARLTVGNGAAIQQVALYLPNLAPASLVGNSVSEQSFTVNGLAVNDTVFINWPGLASGWNLIAGARVSAANTLTIAFGNVGSGAATPPAGVYRVVAIRT